MHAIQVNKLGLGEYFKVEPTDLASVHGVFAEWGCNTALTADQLETKLAVPPLLPQHTTAHTPANTHARTHAHPRTHCAGGAGEACAELRRVNVAQAARIAQLEAELRACKRGAPWPLLAPRGVRCMLGCPRRI